MRPYLYLRRWWRRTSQSNRVITSLALCIVVALAAWAASPTGGNTTTVRQTAGAAGVAGETALAPSAATATAEATGSTAGAAAAGGAIPAAGGSAAGGTSAAGGGSMATGATSGAAGSGGGSLARTSTPGCLRAPSGTPGVTDKSILVAGAIVDLAGPIGNSAAGLGSADDLARMGQAVIDDINARGGIQCRTLTMKTYKVNPLSQDQQQAQCLQIGQDKPFIAIDVGGFANPPGSYACIPRQKIPLAEILSVTPTEIRKFSPYLMSTNSDLASGMRTLANGLKERGWFDPANGFKKLGLLYDDCNPEVNGYLDAALAKNGITSAQISKYTFACPASGFPPPSEISQGVTQHRLAGVTHVIPLTGSGSFNSYTNVAQGQGFHPKYAVSDYQGFILTQAGPLGASGNRDNFDRGIAITQTRYGQDSTPGIQQDAGTLRCQAILVKAGFAPGDVFQKGGGLMCTQIWAVEAALKHAQALTRDAALPGLFSAGTVQYSFPLADAVYRAPYKFAGGDTWWPVEWHKEDGKWHVLDRTRKPSWP